MNVRVLMFAAALTVAFSPSNRASAQLILYDGFNYPTTASTTSAPPAVGDRSLSGEVLAGAPNISFANTGGYLNSSTGTKWSPININAGGTVYNTAADADIVSGSLSYAGLETSVGNAVAYGGNGYSPRLIFSPISFAGEFPTAATPGPAEGVNDHDGAANIAAANSYNGSLFYSALLRVDSLSESADVNGDPVIHFHGVTTQGASAASAHFAGTYVKPNPGDPNTFFLGITKGESVNGALATYGTTAYPLGTTLLIVGEWQFVANSNPSVREANDIARLYVNPATLGGDAPTAPGSFVEDVFQTGDIQNDLPLGSVALTSIVLSQRRAGVPNVTVDEVRVGRTFASVTPHGAAVDDADFDVDGDVDGDDFLTWQRGLGGAPTKPNGNANGDAAVDSADLAVWKNQFGAAAVVASAVPEPAGLMLISGSLLAVAAIGRRRRKFVRG